MKSSLGKQLAALIALVLLLVQPAAARVPDPYARDLARQLARAETMLGQHGYQRVAGPFAGLLPERLNQRFQFTLRAGQDYELIGVCDGRCRDIDMRIYDANDQVLGADTLTDDVPMLRIHPVFTGLYTVEVTMNQCAVEACYFAYNVYAR